MGKTTAIILAAVAAGVGGALRARADASATVVFALGRVCADGSAVDGKMSVGYAPTESRNAVVAIDGETLLNAGEAGTWTWHAATAGTYTISHTVAGDVMSATYVVTNGYATVEETPKPPMELVEGVSFTPSGEIAVAAKGARQVVTISGNGEEWTGATSADWLKLNSTSGTAIGKSVVCTVAENASVEDRVGYVYIAGRPLKVVQSGRGGATVAAEAAVDAAGGEVAVAVSVLDATTMWNARSECSWVQVETAQGTGSGEAKLLVSPWNRAASRTGTVTVAGRTVTVTQRAATFECPTATETNVVAEGASGAFTITTVQGVTWRATSDAAWLVVGDDAGPRHGCGTVSWEALPQALFESRTATITVTPTEDSGLAPLTFLVTQDAAKAEIEGGLVRCCSAAGRASLVVNVRVDVETASWTPEISEEAKDAWVFLMSGEGPATGEGTFELYVASAMEGDELPRTATVAVGNATLRIVQADGVVIEDGHTSFIIPTSWFAAHPALGGTTAAEWQKIAEGAGAKTDASGAAQPVWHDYVAGTDPTDAADRFTASIAFEDGKPVVSWSPALNGEGVREGVRVYRVWGKVELTDAAWVEVAPGGESGYRFFRVTVEMP